MLKPLFDFLMGIGVPCLVLAVMALLTTLFAVVKGMVILPSSAQKAAEHYRDMVDDRNFWRERYLAGHTIGTVAAEALGRGDENA